MFLERMLSLTEFKITGYMIKKLVKLSTRLKEKKIEMWNKDDFINDRGPGVVQVLTWSLQLNSVSHVSQALSSRFHVCMMGAPGYRVVEKN